MSISNWNDGQHWKSQNLLKINSVIQGQQKGIVSQVRDHKVYSQQT